VDEEKHKDVLKRVDELIAILKFLSEDLQEISRNLRASLNVPTEAPAQPPTMSGRMRTIEDIQGTFPQELAGLVYFEDAEDVILVKPRHYLESENFRKIAAIVRDQLGGEYISAGKDSHFRIQKSKPSER